MIYLAEIEYELQGIPCLIGVIEYSRVDGSFSFNADSDLDYYGYTECDWRILDQRGRPAPWLKKKIDAKEESYINEVVNNYME